jgi:hypothetical protein
MSVSAVCSVMFTAFHSQFWFLDHLMLDVLNCRGSVGTGACFKKTQRSLRTTATARASGERSDVLIGPLLIAEIFMRWCFADPQ